MLVSQRLHLDALWLARNKNRVGSGQCKTLCLCRGTLARTSVPPQVEKSISIKLTANGGGAPNQEMYKANEEYQGDYPFAPVEAQIEGDDQVVRECFPLGAGGDANSGRIPGYLDVMYERSCFGAMIVGAWSAGLSCVYRLAKSRPDRHRGQCRPW